MDAIIQVFTYREGLLSKLAHDLRLTLTRFDISARGTQVSARLDPGSLRVDGVVRDGRVERGEPSPSDKQKIQETIAREVLHTREHPEARYQATVKGEAPNFLLEGTLTLHGDSRPLNVRIDLRDNRLWADFEIVPSRWSIKPYRALGGTLKVRDNVRITVDASAAWLSHGSELNPAVELVWTARASRTSLRPSN